MLCMNSLCIQISWTLLTDEVCHLLSTCVVQLYYRHSYCDIRFLLVLYHCQSYCVIYIFEYSCNMHTYSNNRNTISVYNMKNGETCICNCTGTFEIFLKTTHYCTRLGVSSDPSKPMYCFSTE